MTSVSVNETFQCPPEQFFSIITDYEKYPEFLSEIQRCEVVKNQGKEPLVEFEIFFLKTFIYRLRMKETSPTELSWVFESGDLFKRAHGKWLLTQSQTTENTTEVSYSVEAQFKLFVPGPIAKTLLKVNLPNMMRSYAQRVDALF